MRSWSHARLHPRGQNVEGGVGEPEKDIRGEHNCTKTSTTTGVERYPIEDMSIGNYTLKIKELCDSLGSINVNIDDDEMVQICLGGLAPRFSAIRSAMIAREKSPSFFDL